MQDNGAKRYFDCVPKQWDSLYSHERRFAYFVNRLLRKGLYERYRLTFEACGDLAGKTVLDIGCGTGRYSIECAKRGAKHVLGIDFAPSMIDFANQMAKEMDVADRCEFVCADFLPYVFARSFDVVLALGFFDYIEDAGPLFDKVSQLKPQKFMASFPGFSFFWHLHRTIRYRWIKRCPIYNYSLEQINSLYRQASFEEFEILRCSRGFFGIAAQNIY